MMEIYTQRGGAIVPLGPDDVAESQRRGAAILDWARYRRGAGATLAEVQAEALALDGVAIVDWPTPADGMVLDKHVRAAGDSLDGMPEPRDTVGFVVFANAWVPPPPPDRLTKVQLLLALMGTTPAVISTADLDAWLENRTFPAGITAAFDAAQVPDDLRRLARLKLADGEGGVSRNDDLIGLLQAAMGADDAQFEAFWRAAAAIPT